MRDGKARNKKQIPKYTLNFLVIAPPPSENLYYSISTKPDTSVSSW